MLKFLKIFQPKSDAAALETMRARFERVTTEMNEVLSDFDELPEIRIDPKSRRIVIIPPEQFADEALALPKPDDESGHADTSADARADADAGTGRETDGESGKETAGKAERNLSQNAA